MCSAFVLARTAISSSSTVQNVRRNIASLIAVKTTMMKKGTNSGPTDMVMMTARRLMSAKFQKLKGKIESKLRLLLLKELEPKGTVSEKQRNAVHARQSGHYCDCVELNSLSFELHLSLVRLYSSTNRSN